MSLYRSGSTRLRWVALLVWVLVIFLFSTNSFSSAETSRLIVPVLKFLLPTLDAAQLQFAHAVCRKAGHVIEYFVLGILMWRALPVAPGAGLKPRLLAVSLVLAVALSDEFHQSFVPSRTSSLTDVGYDFIGGLVGLLFVPRFRNETRNLRSHSVL